MKRGTMAMKGRMVLLVLLCLSMTSVNAQVRGGKSTKKVPTQKELRANMKSLYAGMFNKRLVIDSIVEYYDGVMQTAQQYRMREYEGGAVVRDSTSAEPINDYSEYEDYYRVYSFMVFDDERFGEFMRSGTSEDVEFRGIRAYEVKYDEKTARYSLALDDWQVAILSDDTRAMLYKELTIIGVRDSIVELEISKYNGIYDYASEKVASRYSYRIYMHIEAEEFKNVEELLSKALFEQRPMSIELGTRYKRQYGLDFNRNPYGYSDDVDSIVIVQQKFLDSHRVTYYLDVDGKLWKYAKPYLQSKDSIGAKWKMTPKEEVGTWQLKTPMIGGKMAIHLLMKYNNGKKDLLELGQLVYNSGVGISVVCKECEVATWKITRLNMESRITPEDEERLKELDSDSIRDAYTDYDYNSYDHGEWMDEVFTLQNYEVLAREVPMGDMEELAKKKEIDTRYEPITREKDRQYMNFTDQKTGVWVMGKKRMKLSYERPKRSEDMVFKFKDLETQVDLAHWYGYGLVMGKEILDEYFSYNSGEIDSTGNEVERPACYKLRITNPLTKKVETLVIVEAALIGQTRKELKIEMED